MILAAKSNGKLPFQIDYFSREIIETEPGIVFAGDGDDTCENTSLSSLVNPLVLETNGDVVPLAYGFGRKFRICNIVQESLTGSLPSFRTKVYPCFRALCQKLRAEILAHEDLPYLNWYERVTEASLAWAMA
jgi:Fe-coproporphyrin III synthase